MRIRLKFFLFLVGCITGMNCFGQGKKTEFNKIHAKDTARLEIIYMHDALDVKKDDWRESKEMLLIGDSIRVYQGYGNYQLDSIKAKKLPFEKYLDLSRQYKPLNESLTIDKKNGIMNFYGSIFINYYVYSEPIPEFEWTLTEETDTIMGHECFKATTNWRGRDWEAWYSDIPIDAGPWKFQGLPGLILKIEDTEGVHSIYAIGLKKEPIRIGRAKADHNKTTRKKYLDALEDHAENAWKNYENSSMVKLNDDQKKEVGKRRLFNSPIELE